MLSIDALIQSETMPSKSNDHKNEQSRWQGKRGDSLVSRPLVLFPKAMTLSEKEMSIRKRSSKNVQVKNWQVVSRRRGAQRYHALLQRIGGECHGMREHLGEIEWADFCQHAKRHYQPRFISRFEPLGAAPTLTCVGPITLGSGPRQFCPHHHTVKLQLLSSKDVEASQATSKALSNLHLDHTIELQQICDVWKQLTPPRAPVWRKYVDHSKLCNLIFEESNVQFRCARWSREHRMCHDMSRSHFGHLITKDELGPNVVVENKVQHQSVETCRVCCTS